MTKNLILEAVLLPLFWLLAFIFITAIGYAAAPFKKQRGILAANLFTWFWYGIGILLGYLQIWNLFLPVNFYSWLCLAPIALFGAIKLSRSGLQKTSGKPTYPIFILSTLILVFLIFSALDNSFIYDSAVYHFYTVKWLNSYPVVPGMGDLFIYLGLNQSYFLFPAFLNGLWGNYGGACATNGLLALAICVEILWTNSNLLQKGAKLSFSAVFQLLFLPLCINIGVQNLSSPTPDVTINLLTFKVISDLIVCLEKKKIRFQDVYLLLFYCLMGVVMKLSFAGVASGVSMVLIAFAISEKLLKLNSSITACIFFSLLLIPWIIRGIISSGYIAFPLSTFGMAVDWKMPAADLQEFAAYIKGFARSHLHGPEGIQAAYGYDWLGSWAKRMVGTFGFIVPVFLLIGSIALLTIRKIKISGLLIVLVPIATSCIFWYFTAPDIRFAVFTFWGLGLAPAAFLISHLRVNWSYPFICFIFICSGLIMIRNWNSNPQHIGDVPKHVDAVFTTKSGLKINTLKNTPPGDDWRIGDCVIPCAIYPDSNLVLRGNGIEEGFRVKLPD